MHNYGNSRAWSAAILTSCILHFIFLCEWNMILSSHVWQHYLWNTCVCTYSIIMMHIFLQNKSSHHLDNVLREITAIEKKRIIRIFIKLFFYFDQIRFVNSISNLHSYILTVYEHMYFDSSVYVKTWWNTGVVSWVHNTRLWDINVTFDITFGRIFCDSTSATNEAVDKL